MANSRGNRTGGERRKFYPKDNKRPMPAAGNQRIQKMSDILPSPAALESYEEILPGMSAKLMEMVSKEQKHRHELELKHLKLSALSARIGQLLSFALAVVIIYFTVILAKQERLELAITLSICGFVFLTIINLLAIYSKKIIVHKVMHSF